ncbi:hypothetical protein Poli38472_012575 [Pythium oligandrum]|uniref:FYVE-type domain-containing protein n=1 Tax=Pythium oligandrum TaxID=41045 RepID=A0A8K1CE52_PYTOL|nr:hypothetical protein Poli38472_012575 [Pythium oligandrum]|eukprot:TMW61384.1 hypothetical protein Poli38472_012575 [Pythium oligandrum]
MPSLKLSPEEQHAAIDEIEAVLAETLVHEHSFRSGATAIDKKRWKEVKVHEGFRVYRERDPKSAQRSFMDRASSIIAPRFVSIREAPAMSTWTTDSSEEDAGYVANIKDPKVPMIVATGTVEGSLEDVVFGALASDEVSWRLRAAYLKDKTTDSKILSTIIEPTEEDPYKCLCIKWFMREIPVFLSPFVLPRDLLVMEATGIAEDEYGERYGYYMLHEFRHPTLPDFNSRKIVRCGISHAYLCRQLRPDKVQIFSRGFVDTRGDVPQTITVQITAETTISAANTVETSYMKKLGWLMMRAQQRRLYEKRPPAIPRTICSCNQSKTSSLLPCQVCGESFCSRCTVHRKIVVDMTADELIERVLPFCFGCVLTAKQMSPHEVAVDTVVRPRAYLQKTVEPADKIH